jgi:hypothetical protein
LLTGDSPSPRWLNQAIEPCYFWGNAVFQNAGGLFNNNWRAAQEYPGIIQENRDFFNTAKPGYAPLTYPHPLNTDAATISSVPLVTPPSGLIVSPPPPVH